MPIGLAASVRQLHIVLFNTQRHVDLVYVLDSVFGVFCRLQQVLDGVNITDLYDVRVVSLFNGQAKY